MAGIDLAPIPSSWGHGQVYKGAMDSGSVLGSFDRAIGIGIYASASQTRRRGYYEPNYKRQRRWWWAEGMRMMIS